MCLFIHVLVYIMFSLTHKCTDTHTEGGISWHKRILWRSLEIKGYCRLLCQSYVWPIISVLWWQHFVCSVSLIIFFPLSMAELLILAVLLFFILEWKCSLGIMDYWLVWEQQKPQGLVINGTYSPISECIASCSYSGSKSVEYKLIIVDLVWYLGQGAPHCFMGFPLLFVQKNSLFVL